MWKEDSHLGLELLSILILTPISSRLQFLDTFVIAAEQGGMEAARQLRSAISEYVSRELKLPANIPIRIRVYANTKGLGSVYYHNDLLRSVGDLQTFVRGFNVGFATCDFVDAGDGKECADSKLKGSSFHPVLLPPRTTKLILWLM